MEKGLSRDEILEMPKYLALMLMGAIGPDKTGLKLSAADGEAFRLAVLERRERRKKHGI